MTRPRDGKLEPASVWLRGVAFLIDWAVVLLLAAVAASGEPDRTRLAVLLGLASLYYIGFLALIGATPGKMAMRMQVTGANGEKPLPDKLILRWLVFFVSGLTVVGLAVSVGLAATDSRRRTLHDRVAGTMVVWARTDEERGRSRGV
jgi:uncharacterized RDD family membrane protein YckC